MREIPGIDTVISKAEERYIQEAEEIVSRGPCSGCPDLCEKAAFAVRVLATMLLKRKSWMN